LNISYHEINKDSIKFTTKTRRWCRLPYLKHPNGCPNYGKNSLCPPKAPFLKTTIDKFNHFYLIIGKFNLVKYKKGMLRRHPNWSDRQAKCVLYWQGSAKKHMKEYIKTIYEKHTENNMFLLSSGSGFKNVKIPQKKIYSMEAAGINVFETLRKNNIEFELKPENYILLVNLLCSSEKVDF
jgi:predicted metal-binding protein